MPNDAAVLEAGNAMQAMVAFREDLNDWGDLVELDIEEFHEFVVQTKDGQFVGPLGLTAVLDQAVRFESRKAALIRCSQMGAAMDRAVIRDYDQLAAAESSGQGNPSPNG